MLTLYWFFSRFYTHMPYLALYLARQKGFSSREIIGYLSIYPITIFLAEIPTGLFADKLGERYSLIVGEAFKIIGLLVLVSSQEKLLVFACQIFIGLGDSFISGAYDSYAYQYYNCNKVLSQKYKNYSSYISHLYSFNWAGITVAFALGSFLYLKNISLNFFVPVGVSLFSMFIIFLLPNLKGRAKVKSIQIMSQTFLKIYTNKTIFYWLMVSAMSTASLVVTYLMTKPLLNERMLAGFSNGILFAAASAFGLLGSKSLPHVTKHLKDSSRFFILLFIGIIVTTLGMAASTSIVIFGIGFSFFRYLMGLTLPYLSSKLNDAIDDNSIRSSILSTGSLVSNLFQATIFNLSIMVSSEVKYQFLFLSILALVMLLLVGRLLVKIRVKILNPNEPEAVY